MISKSLIMYPSFSVSSPIASYHQQQVQNGLHQKFHPKEDLVSLRCPQYAFQLMSGLLEVMGDAHLQDITLVCSDGKFVRSNKLLLSASSPYFRQVLPLQGSQMYLPGITSDVLNLLLIFMLQGDIQVNHSILTFVIQAATTLQIRGFQAACSMVTSFTTREQKHPEHDNKYEGMKPAKKRKLEVEDHISENGSASLFRPWSISVSSSKEEGFYKPNTLAQLQVKNNTPSFMVPNSPSSCSKPSSVCVSPNASLDFAPLLASTMKNIKPTVAHTVPVIGKEVSNIPVNITPTSPTGWSSVLEHTTDFTTPLSGTLEKIKDKTDFSHIKSPPSSLNQFSTPKSYVSLVPRTPKEIMKADPTSVNEVLYVDHFPCLMIVKMKL